MVLERYAKLIRTMNHDVFAFPNVKKKAILDAKFAPIITKLGRPTARFISNGAGANLETLAAEEAIINTSISNTMVFADICPYAPCFLPKIKTIINLIFLGVCT